MVEKHCTYKKVFPVGVSNLMYGGFYSLTDVPIMEHKEMTRTGVIVAKNEEKQYFKVRDTEKNFTGWVPMVDVEVGVEVSG